MGLRPLAGQPPRGCVVPGGRQPRWIARQLPPRLRIVIRDYAVKYRLYREIVKVA